MLLLLLLTYYIVNFINFRKKLKLKIEIINF